MAIKKVYIHPNNIEEIKTYFPHMFETLADSNTPEKTHAVVGGVYHRGDDRYYPQYWTYGWSPATPRDDQLEKVDEENSRICCYLDNFETEVVDGITMPYLRFYDDTTCFCWCFAWWYFYHKHK